MSMASPSHGVLAAAPDHVSGPASWALQALFILFGLFFTGIGAMMLAVALLLPQSQLLLTILISAGSLILGLAHLGAFWGLNRRTAAARTLGTFVSGFYMMSGVLLPLAIGVMWILWHPHLPASGGHSLRGVLAALATPHDRSGAAQDHPVDGIDSGSRRALCALLALGGLFAVWFTFGSDHGGEALPVFVVLAVIHLLMLGVIAAAIIGIGRGTEWGRPLAVFAAGALTLTAYGLIATAAISALLWRTRAGARLPAAATTGSSGVPA